MAAAWCRCLLPGPPGIRRCPLAKLRRPAASEMRSCDRRWSAPAIRLLRAGRSPRRRSAFARSAIKASGVVPFEVYVLRHTCLTRWGDSMDPWKLKKYAGHADMKTTARYIHPRDESMEEAMEQARAAQRARVARGGHTCGHTEESRHSERPQQSDAIN